MKMSQQGLAVRLACADDGLLLQDAQPFDRGRHDGFAQAPLPSEGLPRRAETSQGARTSSSFSVEGAFGSTLTV